MSSFGINNIPHYCYGDVVYVSAEWYVAKPIEVDHFDRMLYYFTGCRYMEFVCYENGTRSGVRYKWDERLGISTL